MAKFSLIPFESNKSIPITISSELNQTKESFFLSFKIEGSLSLVDWGTGIPEHSRAIRLWEKTCFEFFIKNEKNSYMEFNFSPDFEWNAFYFIKKGDALKEYLEMKLETFDILMAENIVMIICEIKKEYFPPHFFDGEITAGISSVIKEKSNNLSYWALSHKDTKPNFHDFSSYIKL
jgi:hypothetical protein